MKTVLYHANCWDGFCAAWLLYNVFDHDAEYIPVQYGNAPPEIQGDEVFIVDFSYKREVLLALKAEHPSLIVLDHHKSAKDDLEGLDFCTFDLDKSGARLTFEYIQDHYPDVLERDLFNPDWLIDYTEDRDLWNWKLPNSKEINTALRTVPLDFETWDGLQHRDLKSLLTDGVAILKAEKIMISMAVKNATLIEFQGKSVPCVNATNLISEIGHRLCEDFPFSLSFFVTPNGDVVFSLRSEGEVDVSDIAVKFGGGGHPPAAGFTGDLDLLEEILDFKYKEG